MVKIRVKSESGYYQKILSGNKTEVFDEIYWFAVEIGESLYLEIIEGSI